jgi:hypothetical protein
MRLCTAFKYEVFLLIAVSIVLFASFAGLRHAEIPVTALTCSTTQNNMFVSLNDTRVATVCVVQD